MVQSSLSLLRFLNMEIDYNALSPMMQHYLKTKEENQGCILFYRLGDFYEMFFEDAETVSAELELTLTGKACGLKERAPMCGVPFHAVDTYVSRLVERGYKIAICDQVEDPKLAKGIVKREVTRIITPGTNMAEQALDENRNNYIMCVISEGTYFGLAAADVTTGDFSLTECEGIKKLMDEIAVFSPAEIVCNNDFFSCGADISDIRNRLNIAVSTLQEFYFNKDSSAGKLLEHFHVASFQALGIDDFPLGTQSAGALLWYLQDTQKIALSHFTHISPYVSSAYMMVDSSTRRNLELTETMREKQKRGSLLWVLDKTKTAMGGRLLRSYVEQPLVDKKRIDDRLDCVAEFCGRVIDREEIREYLGPVYDIERLLGRISYRSANPRDLIALKTSLGMLPPIRSILSSEFSSPLIREIFEDFDDLRDIYALIDAAVIDDPPLAMKDGGIIKDGYNETVDSLKKAKTEGKGWLSALEEQERERTGIKNLRIKYNKVFGYYFEVTNSFKDLVPDDYIRKQTLTGAERFTTAKLKELEDVILNAEDRLFSLEYDLFSEVREAIYSQMERIQRTAKAIARLDVFTSLSYVAEKNHYVRPNINENGIIDIKEGRHPVVEKMLPGDSFISNDTFLDNGKSRISIITGPNMAGKSTYMRQTALITLMAAVGSFVPAASADICICDRIFTRVGASDDLASGQSTFMVEMTEVANILRNATDRSLLILDEIGRGTATFDGLSIAWAVVEYIANTRTLGAKTLFATHYHELTELEGKLQGVNNYCIAVREQGDDIIFLRKIIKGGADKSYGIQVARLAGVPEQVLSRASELVDQLLTNDITAKIKDIADLEKAKRKVDQMELNQISLFDTQNDDNIIDEIAEIDLTRMTPIDALLKLQQLQSKITNRYKP